MYIANLNKCDSLKYIYIHTYKYIYYSIEVNLQLE